MSTAETTSIILVDARSTSMTVTWPAVKQARRYILAYQSIDSTTDSETTTTATDDFEILSSRLTQTQARKKNLSPSTRYLFRVAPVLEDGEEDPPKTVGPWTTHEEAFSTLSIDEERRSMSAPIVTDARSNRALLVSWASVEGTSSRYCLQMRENRGGVGWNTISASLSGTQVKKKNLHSPLGYQFRVRPIDHDAGGEVEDSTIPHSPPSDAVIAKGLSPGIRQFFASLDNAANPTLLRSGNALPVPLADALGGKEFVLVYASAHWCPPCRQFTPQLANWYRLNRDRVEVVFLSCDHDAAGFDGYFSSQPWLAVGYHDGGREKLLAAIKVTGIPRLVVLSGRTGAIIENNAVGTQLDLDRWRSLDR